MTKFAASIRSRFQIVGEDDLRPAILLRELAAEVVGTFFLIYIGCGGVGGSVMLNTGTSLSAANALQIAFSFGIGIGGAVHLFSDISGGHFNPAVSLALFFSGNISLLKTALFSIAQLGGGFLGGGILRAMLGTCPGSVELKSFTLDSGVKAVQLTTASGFFIEFIGTLFLVLTVLATTNPSRKHQPSYMQPFSIGLAIFCLHTLMIPTTGCGLNPVRSLVPNVIENNMHSYFALYIFAPLVASLVGGILYTFVFSTAYCGTVEEVEEENEVPNNPAPKYEVNSNLAAKEPSQDNLKIAVE